MTTFNVARGDLSFSLGADLRVRQEIYQNVPGLPGGGLLLNSPRSKLKNHIRIRPDIWGELKFAEKWRLYSRLTDEFRYYPVGSSRSSVFPDEVVVDNLFLEGLGLWDGAIDVRVGRQNLYGYLGLDHIFVDGTPGDGSRTTYTDMANLTWHVDEKSTVDVFALFNADRNPLRFGDHRSRSKRLAGLGGTDDEMNDGGFGVVWGVKDARLDYQLFAVEKFTSGFRRGGEKHPNTYRGLLGFKLVPHVTENFDLQFEGMQETGRNGADDTLSAWSAYVGGEWRDRAKTTWQPFVRVGLHYMSGDKDAAREDGGHHAWDPMWSRGVNDSEIFLYGTHYGVAWWSNQIFLNTSGGVLIGPHHAVTAASGPLFAAVKDDMGGGDGAFKGLLSHLRYDFPIWTQAVSSNRSLQIFGHIYAELFNPGDYFVTDKPAWFLRWQVEFRF